VNLYNTPDVIELPRSLLPSSAKTNSRSNSSILPEYVSVCALSKVQHATKVLVQPLTTEDWELMEMHSEGMELGGWLQQVSLVYTKQKLSLRVGTIGRDCVHLIVSEAVGNSGNYGIETHDSVGSRWTSESVEAPCVLLVQDTEVIVKPKPRPSKKSISWSIPLRLIPCHLDWSQCLSNTVSRMTNYADDCQPLVADAGCILVNTDVWTFETDWARIIPELTTTEKSERIVRVVKSSRVSMDDAGTLKKFLILIFVSTYFQ
jgi:hypothetical protein